MQRIDQIVLQWKRYFIHTAPDKSVEADVRAYVEEHPSLKELFDEMGDNDRFIRAVKLYNSLSQDRDQGADDPLLAKILDRIQETKRIQRVDQRKRLRYWLAGAAACIALVSGILLLKPSEDVQPADAMEVAAHILPSQNGAVLSISDGRNIQLRSEESGIITGEQLRYADGSPLFEDGAPVNDAMMTLSVPRGSDFYVVLADGTKVWMNAESELRYPQTFTGTKRVVQLTGEAYFEVIKNKQKPFVVETPTEHIEVLGTHFNVNSYPKERKSSVTLVEGKVVVSVDGQDRQVLHPGQQSIVQGKQLRVQNVNIDEYIAWKNGEFMFNEESLMSAGRKIGRWYNLEIDVDPALKDLYLWGSVPRKENFGEVLKLIQLTNKHVKVKIEGRRVYFMK
ncbi:FecR family protein [Sphingobacterium arenae]|uniref:FecR family protein n=1 Tax=Sphingobacterium arenae TaxID=1280598 RepID=A0ABR7Y083_9SPHI|nr:FecR family protein [Sphingobacterium arenae]MBD1424712.1 FecR family protein [Sphingobacterium arenae]